MGGRQDDEIASSTEMQGCSGKFGAVIGDMLEHVDVKYRLKPGRGIESGNSPGDHLPDKRQFAPRGALCNAACKRSIGFYTRPIANCASCQVWCIAADACADLQHLPAHVGRQQTGKISLPISSVRKQLQFGNRRTRSYPTPRAHFRINLIEPPELSTCDVVMVLENGNDRPIASPC